ncbi:hypothetical protein Pint_14770 [Pistacia integerrima]|uniref:Uncharacterized protein n=1 Tax=Pistacia integerrima TaxID=434235 RepID=A0ACC0YBV1_9ROSI|nr:hypothetical protein Pint_14770 [Pistacia integerrima]
MVEPQGNLSGERQGQPVFVTKMEGYRSSSASETQNAIVNIPLASGHLFQLLSMSILLIFFATMVNLASALESFLFRFQPDFSSTVCRLAANWPPLMQIVRLISEGHMHNKKYDKKADFLMFWAMNQHGFLGQLQEKKLCAVIQLPSQTLLLSVSDKASRLMGMLLPGVRIF